MVDAGGNAPLVGFRTSLTTAGLQSAIRNGVPFGKMVAREEWQAPVTLRVFDVMSVGSGLPGLRLNEKELKERTPLPGSRRGSRRYFKADVSVFYRHTSRGKPLVFASIEMSG